MIIATVQAAIRARVDSQIGRKIFPIHGEETVIADRYGLANRGVNERSKLSLLADAWAALKSGAEGKVKAEGILNKITQRESGLRVTQQDVHQVFLENGANILLMSGTISRAMARLNSLFLGAQAIGVDLSSGWKKPWVNDKDKTEVTSQTDNNVRQAVDTIFDQRANKGKGSIALFDVRDDRGALVLQTHDGKPVARFDKTILEVLIRCEEKLHALLLKGYYATGVCSRGELKKLSNR